MRWTLLMQRMEEVLTPRELNLVRSYLGIGQPDEIGMTFQELAIYLNYNGPSGAEKAYKAALRKLKKDLYSGAYGRWLSAQKAIRAAKAEAEQDAGYDAMSQRTWWEDKNLTEHFLCEVISLIHVYEIFSDISKNDPGYLRAGHKASPKQTKACADWHTPLFNYFAFLWHIPVYVRGVPKNSFVAFRTFGHKKNMAIRFGMVRRPRAMS